MAWVHGTDYEGLCECKGIARAYPVHSYRAEGYGRISLLLFVTHYLRYLGLHPPDALGITSYCDNSSLLNREEAFHTRDIDSPSFYAKPDHDINMTLSELRANLPLRLASLHVRGCQDETCGFDPPLHTRTNQCSC
jgi:hypothetical protein